MAKEKAINVSEDITLAEAAKATKNSNVGEDEAPTSTKTVTAQGSQVTPSQPADVQRQDNPTVAGEAMEDEPE